jgi:hypothetical protein
MALPTIHRQRGWPVAVAPSLRLRLSSWPGTTKLDERAVDAEVLSRQRAALVGQG